METINFYYENPEQLASELDRRGITGGSNVLVQVFAGTVDQQHTIAMIKALKKNLPGTPILGSTTAGEILDADVTEHRNVISIARFRNARIRTSLMPQGDGDMRDKGRKIAEELIPDPGEPGEKVMIIFGDGTNVLDATAVFLMEGLNDARPGIPIAGGRAANATGFEQNFGRSPELGLAYVFTERGLTTRGAAGASIVGRDLQIHRDVNLGWKTIGKKMRITRTLNDGLFTRVFEIDGVPPLEIYRRYFGDEVADSMPISGMNFPFVAMRDELEIAATPMQVFDDGSLIFTAQLIEGETIQFGFGEPGLVLNESMRIARTIADYPNPVEGLFVYSCATRRKQLDHVAAHELRPFHNIAPMSGFLTGGEFYHTQSQNLAIGQTMTILSISESSRVENPDKIEIPEAAERKTIDSMLAIQNMVQRMTDELEEEQKRSEDLLLNVLPESIAARLKTGENTIAERFDDATVLFADIVGFTELSSRHSPEEVVSVLNEIFSSFDGLVEKHGLEKIKTIGDAYMVAGGIPDPIPDHAERSARMALDMLGVVERFRERGMDFLNIRVGLHHGPIVAGVLGSKKFAYDLWGDTVNTASRMESSGQAGRVQVTGDIHERLAGHFDFEERGEIEVKGKGTMRTFFLNNEKVGAGA